MSSVPVTTISSNVAPPLASLPVAPGSLPPVAPILPGVIPPGSVPPGIPPVAVPPGIPLPGLMPPAGRKCLL